MELKPVIMAGGSGKSTLAYVTQTLSKAIY